MSSRFSIIVSFILVSFLAVGGVELFYRTLEKALQQNPKEEVTTLSDKTVTLPTAGNIASSVPTKKVTELKQNKDYSIISQRQLFGTTQKEITPPPPKAAPVLATTSLDLTLLGTIGGEGDVQRAIILDKRERKQDLYYNGDAIGPALIKEVERGKVILTIDGKDEVLLMQEPKSLHSKGNTSVHPDNIIDNFEDLVNIPEDDEEVDFPEDEEVDAPEDAAEPILTPPIARKSRARKMIFKRPQK